MSDPEVIVVGSGPNGLSAAITMAQEGYSVLVLEANPELGGGMRTSELTLPGFRHDVCSAIHPLAVASPFLSKLALDAHGLQWIEPPIPVAHPLDGGRAVGVRHSVTTTAAALGPDAETYEELLGPLVEVWEDLLGRFLRPLRLARYSVPALRFAAAAVRSTEGLCRRFETDDAKALFAGLAGHSVMPLEKTPSASAGLLLALLGHAVGWPFPRGGAKRIADAMASVLYSLGGRIETGHRVASLDDLPPARAILLDLTPAQILRISGDRLPAWYRSQLRAFRYGPGVSKIDLALDGPIPWSNQLCSETATVHVGGSYAEIADAEARVWRGEHPERPFVLLAQNSLFDETRAPAGRHVVWAYCHVPNASTIDMSPRIEAQIERFAPGFRDRILARHVMLPAELERRNQNLVGGDINGGAQTLWQMFARPALRWNPYATPLDGVYVCSASTPPGGGVHGMCGHLAAKTALLAAGGRARSRAPRRAHRIPGAPAAHMHGAQAATSSGERRVGGPLRPLRRSHPAPARQHPQRMDDAGDPADDGEDDVEHQLKTDSGAQQHGHRWQEYGEQNFRERHEGLLSGVDGRDDEGDAGASSADSSFASRVHSSISARDIEPNGGSRASR